MTQPSVTPHQLSDALQIRSQPDEMTCGPTCLHAVYHYYGLEMPLNRLIGEIPQLEDGGTLAVNLANHALVHGFEASIISYNLQIFDPTWFKECGTDFKQKLKEQARVKPDRKLRRVTADYLEFLDLGGIVTHEEMSPALLARLLDDDIPILTGLSATYLYNCAREFASDFDDIRGLPEGHFVVLCGYDHQEGMITVADPLLPNPVSGSQKYQVPVDRVIASILLGALTYDANLTIITPRED